MAILTFLVIRSAVGAAKRVLNGVVESLEAVAVFRHLISAFL
jgi:hypothetical protein